MSTFLIANLIFGVGILATVIYLYLEIVKLKVINKDITTIYKQISDIILHMDKTDKALSGLAASLDKIVEVLNDSVLPNLPKSSKEPEVKVPVKRSRKKKTTE